MRRGLLVFFFAVAAWVCAADFGTDDARTITLELSSGEAVPGLGMRPGHLTTLSFRDRTGAPRAIIVIESSTDAVEVVRMSSHPHVATLRVIGRRQPSGNVVALVDGVDVPVHLSLAAKAPQALRVVVSIDVGAPAAVPATARREENAPLASGTLPELDSSIRDYLLRHPEVIREALDPARQMVTRAHELRDEFAGAGGVPIAGDPAGAVTVVEFFDYLCGYCKRSAGAVREAISTPGVRVELRDYPILGPSSERASRLALAAGLQGRYEEAHFALMAWEGGFGPNTVADLAAELGVDLERLETDMQSAEVTERIDANRALAQRLGVTGTPAFLVVGPEAVRAAPGAVDAARIAEMIEAVN